MPTLEMDTLMQRKNKSGDTEIHYPVTHTGNVLDLTTDMFLTDLLLYLQHMAQNAMDTALYANDNAVAAKTAPACEVSAGIMSAEDFIKLRDIEDGANRYTHPDAHPAGVIIQDENHRFLTDGQIMGIGEGIGSLNADIASIQTQLSRLSDGLYEDLTDNPFSVTFDSLAGLVITGFVWNKTFKRLEV